MSHATAYNRIKYFNPTFPIWASGCSWYVLKDRNGKVRDWAPGEEAIDALGKFRLFRNYRALPKGYTVEKRGPVTKENW